VTPARRNALWSALAAANPAPTTELVWQTPFELLVAVILSAQATDVGVNKATTKLFPVANTPAAILALGEAGLTPYIRTIGLFNTKCRNILATCQLLLEKHGGQVPRDRAALEALPGVGRKTANVVLNTAFGEPTIAVDTHIFRVEPHGARRRQDTPGRRGRPARHDPAQVPQGRAPLAHPARTVRLQGATAGLRALRHFALVRVRRQERRAEGPEGGSGQDAGVSGPCSRASSSCWWRTSTPWRATPGHR
jgi:endonuclease III